MKTIFRQNPHCAFLLVALMTTSSCALYPAKTEPGSSSKSNGLSAAPSVFTPSNDPRKDVRDAMARLNSAYPYRLTETMSALGNGANTMPGGTRVVEFEAADRLHMKWTGGIGGDVEAITIGDKHYWYSEGKWTGGGVNQHADPGLDLSKKLADLVKDVKYVGPETINGVACQAYTCTFDGPMAGQSWSGTSKIWIGTADGLPHQSDSDIKFSGYGGKSHIVYEYGGNIKVEKPAM